MWKVIHLANMNVGQLSISSQLVNRKNLSEFDLVAFPIKMYKILGPIRLRGNNLREKLCLITG